MDNLLQTVATETVKFTKIKFRNSKTRKNNKNKVYVLENPVSIFCPNLAILIFETIM